MSILKRAISLAAAAAIALSLLSGCSAVKQNSSSDYVAYVKDHELFISDLSKGNEYQVSTDLTKVNRDDYIDTYSKTAWLTSGMEVAALATVITKDGKTIFYPDKWDDPEDLSTFSLYYRCLKDSDESPVKIDSNVELYGLREDVSLVWYWKPYDDDLHLLYLYDLKNGEKTKVGAVYLSGVADNGDLIYLSDNGDLYLKRCGEDPLKLASEIGIFADASFYETWYDNFDAVSIYYSKNDSLYRIDSAKNVEKIASDVYAVIRAYESGELYLERFYPDGYDEVNNAINFWSLYYYDGESEKLISDNASGSIIDASSGSSTPIVVYNEYEGEACIAVGGNSTSLSGRIIYALIGEDDNIFYIDENWDMYYVSLSNGELQAPTIYDTDVERLMYIRSDGKPIYLKGDYYLGDLYIGKDCVCVDVDAGSLSFNSETDTLLFFSDLTDNCGRLNMYTDGKLKTIAEDAYSPYLFYYDGLDSFYVLPDGSVLYFSDYDEDNYIGQLSIYRDGKSSVVADDVSCFVHLYDSKIARHNLF